MSWQIKKLNGVNMTPKHRIKTCLASTLMASSIAFGAAGVSLIDGERNIAALNDQNLSEKTYILDAPGSDATQFKFELKGYVFGLRMIRANYAGWYDQTRYSLYSDIKTSGLGALLKKLEIWAVTKGRHDDIGLHPEFHVQQNLDKKNRRVEMNYSDTRKAVDVAIVPRLGSQGVPPASPAERYAADDTLSAILNMMMRGWGDKGDVCDGTVKVFDSKQHYGLRMEPAGTKRLKFDGEKFEALRCHVYYEPISGFDPEDLPEVEESTTPVKVYFQHRPELGLYIPIRFTYKISAIKATIKVDEAFIVLPGQDTPIKLDD
jgi:hypothetical protein